MRPSNVQKAYIFCTTIDNNELRRILVDNLCIRYTVQNIL